MKSFGEIIRDKRVAQQWILRHVAALVDIDQAIISKFERGERRPSKLQVLKFAEIYKLDEKELLTSWYSDKIAYEILEEDNTASILEEAASKVKYLKSKDQ